MNALAKVAAPVSLGDMLALVESLQLIRRTPDAILRTMQLCGARLQQDGDRVRVAFGGVEDHSTLGDAMALLFWTHRARIQLSRDARP